MLAVVLALVGLAGGAYYWLAPRLYRSSAQILLIKRDGNLAGDAARRCDASAPMGYEDVISTHMLLICSPRIVDAAVEKAQLGRLASFHEQDARKAILAGLRAARQGERQEPDPNVMSLSYSGVDPEDARVVLGAVIAAYQSYLGVTWRDGNEETLRLIAQARDGLHKQLTEKEASYRTFRQSSPLLWTGAETGGVNVHESRQAEIEKARSAALLDCAQAEARLEALQAAIRNGASREVVARLATPGDPRALAIGAPGSGEYELFTAVEREKQALEQFGPNHPQVITAAARIAALRTRLGQPARNGEQSIPGDDVAQFALQAVGQELALAQGRRAKLEELFKEEQRRAQELARFQAQDETYRNAIARTQRMFDAIVRRLEEISVAKGLGGIFTEVISPPLPGQLTQPLPIRVLATTLAIGLLAAFSAVGLAELADRSFRNAADIRRQLGLPVFGHIPVIEASTDTARVNAGGGAVAVDSRLCTCCDVNGPAAEAYRSVRTALLFGARGENHKIIQVSSPHPGDGKTTLAANLAASLADSGKRVLLVDADFRRPRVHAFFGLPNDAGLSSVLAAGGDVEDFVQPTVAPNLWVLPAGPSPRNPADVLALASLAEVLAAQRRRYDYVIIDTPPVLAVTDATLVASRVDALLLVMRLGRHAREGAVQTMEQLQGVGAPVIGVVVNGVTRGDGYYHYGYRNARYDYPPWERCSTGETPRVDRADRAVATSHLPRSVNLTAS